MQVKVTFSKPTSFGQSLEAQFHLLSQIIHCDTLVLKCILIPLNPPLKKGELFLLPFLKGDREGLFARFYRIDQPNEAPWHELHHKDDKKSCHDGMQLDQIDVCHGK